MTREDAQADNREPCPICLQLVTLTEGVVERHVLIGTVSAWQYPQLCGGSDLTRAEAHKAASEWRPS